MVLPSPHLQQLFLKAVSHIQISKIKSFHRSHFNEKIDFFKGTFNGNEFNDIVLDHFWELGQSE